MQKKIQNLLEMTNASIQLMSDMTGVYVHVCVCYIHTNVLMSTYCDDCGNNIQVV